MSTPTTNNNTKEYIPTCNTQAKMHTAASLRVVDVDWSGSNEPYRLR